MATQEQRQEWAAVQAGYVAVRAQRIATLVDTAKRLTGLHMGSTGANSILVHAEREEDAAWHNYYPIVDGAGFYTGAVLDIEDPGSDTYLIVDWVGSLTHGHMDDGQYAEQAAVLASEFPWAPVAG